MRMIEHEKRLKDAHRRSGCDPRRNIGDELTETDLDDLWVELSGALSSRDEYTSMGRWWRDKPHQIGYRLLLRLTRAEERIAELEGRVLR